MTLPLEGIRVLDLTRFFAGPFCTQILADFGAEVIKIEDVQGGDPGRWLPPLVGGESALFFTVNRNKKSVTVDMRKEEGKKIFKELVKKSDIIVDAFRPGVMQKMGLGYEELSQINEGIIYCALNGYGSNGPLCHSAGHDINFLGLSGVNLLTASRDGRPALSSGQISSSSGAYNAVIAILMALLSRQQTGKGQFCDIAMVDVAINQLSYALGEWSGTGSLPEPGKEILTGGYACYNLYGTLDEKYISIGAVETKFWTSFCQGIGKPEYIDQQWNSLRQSEMIAGIEAVMRTKPRLEWEKLFAEQDICFAPLLSLDELKDHPQIHARQMLNTLPNFKQSGIDLTLTNTPIKLSDTPAHVNYVYASLGQHNEEFLSMLGYSGEEIKRLREAQIIF